MLRLSRVSKHHILFAHPHEDMTVTQTFMFISITYNIRCLPEYSLKQQVFKPFVVQVNVKSIIVCPSTYRTLCYVLVTCNKQDSPNPIRVWPRLLKSVIKDTKRDNYFESVFFLENGNIVFFLYHFKYEKNAQCKEFTVEGCRGIRFH